MKVSRNIEDYEVLFDTKGWYLHYLGNSIYLSGGQTWWNQPYYWKTKQEAEDFLKEFCMENYAMIEGKKVKLSDETIKELKKALIPEETYQVGDVLISSGSYYKVLIANLDSSTNRVGLICIGDGNCKGQRYSSNSTIVCNTEKITKEELRKMTHVTIKWEKVCE